MYIVFDIGASNIRLASSENRKTLNKVAKFPTPQNFDDAVSLLTSEVNKLTDGQAIQAIAGGVASQLNKMKTEIIRAANLPDWSGKPLAKKLTEIFQCPVLLENDCALGALGESEFGAGKDFDSLIYIAIGTGIGGAWILDNKLVEGSYSFDIGHQIIDPNGPLCPGCQQPGHLEAFKNTANFKKYFTIGLYNTLLHWPADVIILGGGAVLNNNWQALEIEVELAVLTNDRFKNVPIRITSLGDEVGLYGALAMLNKEYKQLIVTSSII